MDRRILTDAFSDIYRQLNDENTAGIPYAGGIKNIRLFEKPIIGFASAEEELFEKFKKPEIIGPGYFAPGEWLGSAKTVIAFFLPFSEAVRVPNREGKMPADEWLYGRIEGQAFVSLFTKAAAGWLTEQGYRATAPSEEPGFSVSSREQEGDIHFESRWSERHAAYAAGLGTFSLSRGLITKKGVAGRYCSIITDLYIEPDKRDYTGVYDYCIKCGACIPRCPVKAISLEKGKVNKTCKIWLDHMEEVCAPRYGCGKCQTGVPCEHKKPI